MGGPFQPQGHVQLLMNLLYDSMDLQQAVDAPRFAHIGGLHVSLEPGFDHEFETALAAFGHTITPSGRDAFGGAQAVMRLDQGWAAASDPRKDGSGPSQTSWLNSTNNTAVEMKLTNIQSAILNYPVSLTGGTLGSNGVQALDLDNASITGNSGQNTGNDTWLEFAFTESSFGSFTQGAFSQTYKGTDVSGIAYFTSTSQTANGDVGGVNDKTADLSKTWAELGILLESSLDATTSDDKDPPVALVQSTSSVNDNGTIYGTWNGPKICPNSSLIVTVNNQNFYYNVAGETNTISLINESSWSLNFTGFSPGTYNIIVTMIDSCTGQTGTGSGTLLISEILAYDTTTTNTKPTVKGKAKYPNYPVRIKILDLSGNVLVNRNIMSDINGDWSLNTDTVGFNGFNTGDYLVEAYLEF
jgi:uncharacterized protein (DUF2141 family)